MNSTMNRDFFLDGARVAVNTSFDHSDYDRSETIMQDYFDLWIQATTKGLKKFVLGVTLSIAEVDISAVGGDDMKFYVNV